MSPPPRARSGTRRRMGSGSPPGSASPPPWSMGLRRAILNPRRIVLRAGDLDEPGEPAGHRGLRHRRVGAGGQLPEREGREAATKLRGRLERRRVSLELPGRRGARERRRVARARSGSAGRGSRGRRSRADWRPPGALRPARAPRARAPSPSRPRRRETPRSIPSPSRRRRNGTSGRSPASARPRRTRRCGRTPRRRAAASAPRGAAIAARSATPHRETRPGGMPSGSRGVRRRVPAAARAAAARGEHAGLGEHVDRVRRALDE